MKKLAAAAGLALVVSTSSVSAGGITPVTPAEVVVVDAQSSNGGILVPILALIMIAAALG